MYYYPFESSVLISIKGKHSARYLQSRLSNDVAKLSIGSHCAAAGLNVQGKVEFFGICAKIADTNFLFYTTGGDPNLILSSLSKFKVADQVDFEIIQDARLFHVSSPEQINLSITDPILKVSIPRIAKYGVDLVISKNVDLNKLQAEKLSPSKFYIERFNSSHLLFPDEINSEVLLAEVGLSNAISLSKGCYVGQEVVAKLDSIGKAPRKLIRIEASGNVKLENKEKIVLVDTKMIGQVLSYKFDEETNRTVAFGLVRNDPSISLDSLQINSVNFKLVCE